LIPARIANAGTDREPGAFDGMSISTAQAEAVPRDLVGEPFEAFYRARGDQVYRALTVTLGDAALAREATDEAMLRAYARWSVVRGYGNPTGWVYKVGLNWATSWWRKVRRERVGADLPPSAEQLDPAAIAARMAMAALPASYRAVVVCRILLDLSTADTALVLGVAEGTVKSRLSRALTALRAALSEGDPHEARPHEEER
jgi:RNA polymerase sigma factor (sigma-70 family)